MNLDLPVPRGEHALGSGEVLQRSESTMFFVFKRDRSFYTLQLKGSKETWPGQCRANQDE